MSPRRVGVLLTGSDPFSKTLWIVDAFDMDGETNIERFIQNNSDCFGRLICFVDVEERLEGIDSEFDDYIRINKIVEEMAGEIFKQKFNTNSKIIDLDMRVDGRKVRCCCCAGWRTEQKRKKGMTLRIPLFYLEELLFDNWFEFLNALYGYQFFSQFFGAGKVFEIPS